MLPFLRHLVQNFKAFQMIPYMIYLQIFLRLKHANAISGVIFISCHLFFHTVYEPYDLILDQFWIFYPEIYYVGILMQLDGIDWLFHTNMPSVLQQFVNCFLEASRGSLTFRHILVISSRICVWWNMKGNLEERSCLILHSRVCWNSSSTASWRHLLEISWIVLRKGSFYWKYFPIGKKKQVR